MTDQSKEDAELIAMLDREKAAHDERYMDELRLLLRMVGDAFATFKERTK
jgi:hypothetical protein